MAKNILLNGVEYSGVTSVTLPLKDGGTGTFYESSGSGSDDSISFFSAVDGGEFTPDSDVTGSYQISHNLGGVPDIIEFWTATEGTATKESINGGYRVIESGGYSKYYKNSANGNYQTPTLIPSSATAYIGSDPTSSTFNVYGSSAYPLLGGVTYKFKLYKFR